MTSAHDTHPRPRTVTRRNLLATTAATAGLAACGTGDTAVGPNTPLRIAACNHVWSLAVQERLPEFEEVLGRPIRMQLLTADQLSSSYNVKLNASGTDIDVMMMRPLQEQLLFARNGWLADLSDRVATPEFAWDDVVEASRDRCTTRDKVLSVPVVTERSVVYYRKDLADPPATLDDLMTTALDLTDKDGGMFGFVGRGQRNGSVSQWSSFLYSHGGDFQTGDGGSGIGTDEAVAAFQFYGDLLHDAGPPGATNMTLEQALPIFAQGKAGFYVDADSVYTNFLDDSISTVIDTVGFAPFPEGPDGSKPYNIPSWALGINEFSGLRDEAWQFLEWIGGQEMVREIHTGGIPGARQSVWDDPAAAVNFPPDLAEAMRLNTENGVGHDRPEVIQVGRARDIVGKPLVAGILGEDIGPVVADADEEFAEFLERDTRQQEF